MTLRLYFHLPNRGYKQCWLLVCGHAANSLSHTSDDRTGAWVPHSAWCDFVCSVWGDLSESWSVTVLHLYPTSQQTIMQLKGSVRHVNHWWWSQLEPESRECGAANRKLGAIIQWFERRERKLLPLHSLVTVGPNHYLLYCIRWLSLHHKVRVNADFLSNVNANHIYKKYLFHIYLLRNAVRAPMMI